MTAASHGVSLDHKHQLCCIALDNMTIQHAFGVVGQGVPSFHEGW